MGLCYYNTTLTKEYIVDSPYFDKMYDSEKIFNIWEDVQDYISLKNHIDDQNEKLTDLKVDFKFKDDDKEILLLEKEYHNGNQEYLTNHITESLSEAVLKINIYKDKFEKNGKFHIKLKPIDNGK